MAKQSDADQALTAEQQLEQRVDAMMDTKPQSPTDTTQASAPLLPGKKSKPMATEPVEEPVAQPEPVSATLEPEESVPPLTVGPANIDTPESDAAIDDIVAQEADTVLAASDAGIAAAQAEVETSEPARRPHGHPVFWFFIALAAILCIAVAATLINPDLLP